MDKVRISINSAPRSGHAWLQSVLMNSTGRKPEISHDDVADQFIIRSNTPVMLLANFENVIQTTILRDPASIIPSIVTKTMGGLGSTTTVGVAMPHEHMGKLELKNLITHQFSVYKRWVDGITNNIDNLMPFTFEQITTDIEFCTRSILDNFDIDYYLYSNDEIPELIEKVQKQIKIHDKGDVGYNNAIPVEKKPDVYYEAVDIINSHKFLPAAMDLYSSAVKKIYKRQESYA